MNSPTEKEGPELESSNPVLNRSFKQRGFAAQDLAHLEDTFSAPAASSLRTGRMTIDDVITRTGILFGVLVLSGAAAWAFNFPTGLLLIGLLAGFGLAMVITFSKKIRPGLVIAYAALEGVVLGTLSHVYNNANPGIAGQAVMGTLCAFGGMLFAYRSGRIRVTPRFTKMIMGAAIGYLILGVVSMIGSAIGLGAGLGLFGVSGFGPLLAMAGVGLASFFLILDFDQIENAIKSGVPAEESWRAAFGLMVTIVWLYMEILRLLSILRRD